MDLDGNCWYTSRDAEVELGTRGERVAFFDAPVNETDPWHGYPIGGRQGLPSSHRPPDVVIQNWYDSNWISYTIFLRLMSGRL